MPLFVPEVEPQAFVVHGVAIESRFAVLRELLEMMNFVKAAKEANALEPVESLSYDSVASYCVLNFKPGFENIEAEKEHPLLSIALAHLSQFRWNGETRHSIQS